ncbi:hybrid sensor histidine kinase/response regulator [Rubrivivax gelatinosus]|uniref:histidine kinase n=1 Tax=Rubrivivax gelatinosus TaxID=28068 RepID=A0A4R2MFA9_RUBGE|nr:ATP-binding protein [Rubrivivax gelatinosus]TCP03437.1 phospho-acceptor domain-containing protein [Rubrivivax gelatinosus]
MRPSRLDPCASAGPQETRPDGCWLYDPRAERFFFVDPAFRQRWVLRGQVPRAPPQRWLGRARADDRTLLRAALRDLAHGAPCTIEYRGVDAQGSSRWIAEDTRLGGRAAGNLPGSHGISGDIAGCRRALRELQDADRRKDEFLAVLVHELRTPLQCLRAASAALAGNLAEPARVIERQVQHLARLVDDLGESTRLTHRKAHLRLQTVGLHSLLQDAIEDLRAEVEARQLTLKLVAPPTECWVRGDPARLAQVFNNLLHNAAKFSAADGRVVVKVEPAEDAQEVTVSVCDEGVGIAHEALATVFDLFAQDGSATARVRDGLGIGLSVVRGLVELHGGHVVAHSDGPGAGSRFDVTLPLTLAPEATRARRILVVEDNADMAAGLQQLLQLDGHAVAVAFDGRSALRQSARWQPDTVILDLELPDLDGREVARSIRGDAARPCPRLIALSGSCEVDRGAMRAAGFDHCLSKPAGLAELTAAISA